MQSTLPKHDVVLLGVGHTNAHVLRMWRMEPIEDARLTCVSNYPIATYSGMLPGVLAGQYEPEAMEIDLVRLCAAAGSRLIVGEVTGLDRQRRELLFADRPPLPFDALSIGIGSVPTREGLEAADETLLPIKPMQTFLARLNERLRSRHGLPSRASAGGATLNGEAGLARQAGPRGGEPLRITVIGAGVGGTEVALCLPARIRETLGDVPYEITLVHGGDQPAEGTLDKTGAAVEQRLRERGVRLLLHRRALRIERGTVTLDDGQTIAADIALWATSASPPPLLKRLGLPTDDRGFLLTGPTLQSVGQPSVFAVGDTGTIEDERLPKAGVYAVREGPILWENIQRVLAGREPVAYQPQRGFLKLINTGDGRAIGEYRGYTFSGRFAWWLKDRIDRRFMAMYQDYSPMPMEGAEASSNGQPRQIRCAGCGGKVGGSVLSRALARLDVPPHERVLVGLAAPDDAAVISCGSGQMAVTADFFAAPLDDPYLVGRMAALHAASDVLVKGARPVAALALATIPPGRERQQEQLLYELLAGGLKELKGMGATLAGGHTIEGPQLTIGYTLLAEQVAPLRAKGGLREGDAIVLTRALGTGVLLAAHMQARLKAEWYQPLVESMLRSNEPAAALLDEFQASAATDVTGFGLAGHLLEMLRASDMGATIDLEAIPLLPGTVELLAERLESTLAPANRSAEVDIDVTEAIRNEPAYRVLFDPQTCGGLLIGIAADRAAALVERLQSSGDRDARAIGRVALLAQPRLRIGGKTVESESTSTAATGHEIAAR